MRKCVHIKNGCCELMSDGKKTPKNCHCPHYSSEILRCKNCDSPFPATIINGYPYCDKCYSTLGLCVECKHSNACEFEDNTTCVIDKIKPVPLPDGRMGQIKNPERIKLLCTGCICFNEKVGCMRDQLNGCDKFD